MCSRDKCICRCVSPPNGTGRIRTGKCVLGSYHSFRRFNGFCPPSGLQCLIGSFQTPYRTLLLSAIGSTSFRKYIFFRFHLVDFTFPSFSRRHNVVLDSPDSSIAFSTVTSASSILIPPCLFDLHLQFFRYGFLFSYLRFQKRPLILPDFFINKF